MITLYLFLIAFAILSIGAMLGIFIGARLRQNTYHGVIVIQESENGLVYRLELAGDPELLVFEDSVTLKIVSPDYKQLIAE